MTTKTVTEIRILNECNTQTLSGDLQLQFHMQLVEEPCIGYLVVINLQKLHDTNNNTLDEEATYQYELLVRMLRQVHIRSCQTLLRNPITTQNIKAKTMQS